MITSNLGLISHCFWDRAIILLAKIAKFPYPFSWFSALSDGDHFRIYGKALRFLKLESSRQRTVKIWWS